MATDSVHRSVRLERIENSTYLVTNDRGGQMRIGTGQGTDFTPVDLLLAGIGGCTAIDVDILTSRRAEPDSFEVTVEAEKVRDENGSRTCDAVVVRRHRERVRTRRRDGEEIAAARPRQGRVVDEDVTRLAVLAGDPEESLRLFVRAVRQQSLVARAVELRARVV